MAGNANTTDGRVTLFKKTGKGNWKKKNLWISAKGFFGLREKQLGMGMRCE
ncbi:MAG: hypothetical protein M3342_13240 [Bacteroidota bacterium]|nr:hypothetical protein [Flavisolibacter sp.]MBD0295623.1 hypothetical protein [Flavisolibacter sp.]MDQ3844959.1 hypothetical protein [Bacteroidota bacterium]